MSGQTVELGRLLVRLGFNADLVREGLTAVNSMLNTTGSNAQRTGNQIHGAGARGAAGFSLLTKATVAVTAAVTAGVLIRNFVKNIAESGKDLENVSKNLGMTANSVSAIGKSAELAGGTAAGIQATIDMLQFQKELYRTTGESSILPFLNYMGINISENISGMEMLLKIREKLRDKSDEDRSKAYIWGKMGGIEEGTLNLILKPDAEFNAIMAQGKANAMTDAESKSSERITRSFTNLEQRLDSLGRVIMMQLEPTILKFNTWLGNTADWIEQKLSAKGFQATASSIVHRVLGVPDNPKDWGQPVDLTGISDLFSKKIPSMMDTFENMDFFRGSFGDFMDENRFKDNPNFGRDLLDRFQLSPGGNSQSNINSSNETNIGEIKIYTKSNDQANEIYKTLSYMFAANSNSAVT